MRTRSTRPRQIDMTKAMRSGSCTTVSSLLHQRAKLSPDKEFIHFLPTGEPEDERILTYRELEQAALRIASGLQSHCVPGDRALMLYPPGIEFVEAFFGCLYAGVIPVPAYAPDRKQAIRRLSNIADASGPRVVLSCAKGMAKLRSFCAEDATFRRMTWLATDTIQHEGTLLSPVEVDNESVAFLQFTSGSTGAPKGVVVSHRNILANSAAIQAAFGQSSESKVLVWLPLFHDMGLIGGLLQPLYSDAELTIMPPRAFLQKPLRWLQRISERRITTSGGPSFAYELCASSITTEQLTNLDLSCWTTAFNGAERVDPGTLDRFTSRFSQAGFSSKAQIPCYGLAENTLLVSAHRPGRDVRTMTLDRDELTRGKVVESAAIDAQRIVSCGNVAFGVDVRVVDPERRIVLGAGEVGEIWVSGSSVALGYWQQPELSEEVFGATLNGNDSVRYLRTGDLGFLEEGELYVAGRQKDLIIIRGRNYHPHDIERTAITSHPALEASGCAAFCFDEDATARLIVVQEVHRSALRGLDGRAITCRVRAAVAAEHGLEVADVVLVSPMALPRTSSGKIQRHRTHEAFRSGTLYGELARLSSLENSDTPVETDVSHAGALAQSVRHWLVTQVARRAGISPAEVDLERSLAEYGLDSATLVELSARLAERIETPLAPEVLFEHPTVSAFVSALERGTLMPETIDFDAELTLDAEIDLNHPYAGDAPPRDVLMTGATGFVGAYLLHELLNRTAAKIRCVVRCNDAEHGLQRIESNLAQYGLDSLKVASRVEALPGDPSPPGFGFPASMYEELAHRIDTVVHCAGEPGWQKPYRALRDINVGGTREALRFASYRRTKAMHFLSTITIFEMRTGGCFEDAVADPRKTHGRGYNQTKAVADRLCLSAIARGLPVAVYRFPFVMGAVVSGSMPLQLTMPELVRGIIETGLMPLENVAANIVPVDYLAKMVAAIMLTSNCTERCYHIVNKQQLGMKDVAEILTDFGYDFRQVPYDYWKTLVATHGNPRLLPLLPLLHSYSADALVSDFLIDPTNTYTALQRQQPELLVGMPSSGDCVRALIRYLQTAGLLARRQTSTRPPRLAQTCTRLPKNTSQAAPLSKVRVSSRRIVGAQADALMERIGVADVAPETVFATLMLDALRRWVNLPAAGLYLVKAELSGTTTDLRALPLTKTGSILDGRAFVTHVTEVGATLAAARQHPRQVHWRDESDTDPVVLAYFQLPPTDAAVVGTFRQSLRNVIAQERGALMCEVVELEHGWELVWRVDATVDADLLDTAFRYLSDTIEMFARTDWTLPSPIALLLPFIEPAFTSNRTYSDYRRDICVHQLFLEQVERTPDRIAVQQGPERLTYRELSERALQLAEHIVERSLHDRELIGIYFDRTPSAIIAMLAVGIAGKAFVPLDPTYPAARLSSMLERSRCSLLLTESPLSSRARELAPAGVTVLAIDELDGGRTQNGRARLRRALPDRANDLMYVMFTSGSTGVPKGVMIEHRSVVNFLLSTANLLDTAKRESWLAVSSFAFDISIMELFVPLICGMRVHVARSKDVSDGQRLAQVLARTKPCIMHATPATWTMLLDSGWRPHRDMLVLSGADVLGEGLKGRLGSSGCKLWNFYGPTETTIYSSVQQIDVNEAVSIGKPINNTQLHVLDCLGEPAPVGVAGDLYIAGEGLARGYLHQPELTEERFIQASLLGAPPARLYKTGDLARLLPNGNVDCLGRVDNQIKLRGFRIEIGEVEAALTSDELVKDCAVVAQGTGEHMRLVAFVVPEPAGAEQVLSAAESSVVARQREVWDLAYTGNVARDTVGSDASSSSAVRFWINSYTGRPFTEPEMSDFFDHTAAQILAFQPRNLLEIGCGSGLLSRRLAPHVASYTGTDFSELALAEARRALSAGNITNATLLCADARETETLAIGKYDLAVLNSVVQYFPSRTYLDAVIGHLVRGASGPRTIFIGDVRDLDQASTFYTLTELYSASQPVSVSDVRVATALRAERESELLLRHEFFLTLRERYPQISHISIRSHQGNRINEMTQFRFNVVLRVNQDMELISISEATVWAHGRGLEQLSPMFARGSAFSVAAIPDGRTRAAHRVRETLVTAAVDAQFTSSVLSELNQDEGVAPELLAQAAHDANFELEWLAGGQQANSATLDAYFKPFGDPRLWPMPSPRSDVALSNAPAASAARQLTIERIHRNLTRRLPSYMIPTSITLLSELPVTVNGKIDRRSLMTRGDGETRHARVPPSTRTQAAVLEVWCEILGSTDLGISDEFFQSGGNSILAARLVQRLNERLGTKLVLQPLFTGCNTVERLSALLDAKQTTAMGAVASVPVPSRASRAARPGAVAGAHDEQSGSRRAT